MSSDMFLTPPFADTSSLPATTHKTLAPSASLGPGLCSPLVLGDRRPPPTDPTKPPRFHDAVQMKKPPLESVFLPSDFFRAGISVFGLFVEFPPCPAFYRPLPYQDYCVWVVFYLPALPSFFPPHPPLFLREMASCRAGQLPFDARICLERNREICQVL